MKIKQTAEKVQLYFRNKLEKIIFLNLVIQIADKDAIKKHFSELKENIEQSYFLFMGIFPFINEKIKKSSNLENHRADTFEISRAGLIDKLSRNLLTISNLFCGVENFPVTSKLKDLFSKTPPERTIFIDFNAIQTQFRTALENYLLLHYIYFQTEDQEESYIRFLVWKNSHFVQYEKSQKRSDILHWNSKDRISRLEDRQKIIEEVLNNQAFQNMPENDKIRLLKYLENGNFSAFKKKPVDLIRACGFPDDFIAMYHEASDYIHSGFSSINQTLQEKLNVDTTFEQYIKMKTRLIILMARALQDILKIQKLEPPTYPEKLLRTKVDFWVNFLGDKQKLEEFLKYNGKDNFVSWDKASKASEPEQSTGT